MNGWSFLNKFNKVRIFNNSLSLGLKYIQKKHSDFFFILETYMSEVEGIN